jgi:uncharacterized membrane protein YphA (DoxX/SURF4 family)
VVENILPGAFREPVITALNIVAAIAGILLIIGLWTPIAGGVIAAAELSVLFSRPFSEDRYPLVHVFLFVLGIALTLLGPGAWSVDARLFGRKLLVTGHKTARNRPSL